MSAAGRHRPLRSPRPLHRRWRLAGLLAVAVTAPLAVWQMGTAAANTAGHPSAPALVRGNDWYLRTSLTAGSPEVSFRFGRPADQPLFGDWNGDGEATPGLFRNGQWLLRDKLWGGSVDRTVQFGRPGDLPVVGDWDGDGDDDLAVFRAGLWLYDLGLTGGAAERTQRFGRPSDTPVAGDWNGTADGGVADLPGVRRGGTWYLQTESTADGGRGVAFSYGSQAGDIPVVGRWQSGPGIDQMGVVRNLEWQLRNSLSSGAVETWFSYGQAGDYFLTWGGSPGSMAQPVKHYRYRIGIKGNIGAANVEHFADLARETLNDQRGWSLGRSIRFSRTTSSTADFTLWLASPEEVAAADPICDKEWSCRVGDDVYVNIERYNKGTTTWSSRPLEEYRQYIIVHEVGHWLRLGHSSCPGSGAAAPVMMQQSIALNGCVVNLWPLPAEKQLVYDKHVSTQPTAALVPGQGAEAE